MRYCKKDVENENLIMSIDSALEKSAHVLHKSSGCCRDGPGCYQRKGNTKVQQELDYEIRLPRFQSYISWPCDLSASLSPILKIIETMAITILPLQCG